MTDISHRAIQRHAQQTITVVIPAHNEASVLTRCLNALLADAGSGEFRVVVVANGCTDATYGIAAQYGPPVEALETPIASKTAALNLAESVLSDDDFPRLYLDADLVLSTQAARDVCRAINQPDTLAAAPKFAFDMAGCSWPVRAFYRVWQSMSYFDAGRLAGAFALSRAGRKRFEAFPDVISDDGYVRLQFAPSERHTIDACVVTVYPPRNLRDLLRIKTRSKLGTSELRRRFPELFGNENVSNAVSARLLLLNPNLWHCAAVYVVVNLIAKRRAENRATDGSAHVWERDTSSRAC